MLRIVLVLTALATFYALSRSGLGTFMGVLGLFILMSPRDERREQLFDGWIVAAALFAAFALPHLISNIVELSAQAGIAIIPDRGVLAHMEFNVPRASSDSERWQSIAEGWNLWQQYPVFGAGLGAFVQSRFDAGLPILIIHSVPVWILAEFGIVGFVVIGGVFAGLLWLSIKMVRDSEYFACGAGLFALLATLAVSGLVHDFFFQRSFWFLLGIFAGVCGTAGLKAVSPGDPAMEVPAPVIALKKSAKVPELVS